MTDNLDFLRCQTTALPNRNPSFAGKPVSPDRLQGMLLGLAVGDALGNTSEGMLPGHRKSKYGWIETYLSNRYAENQKRGVPSDDTQLAFYLVEQLLENGALNPEQLAKIFVSREIYGMGMSVNEFRKKVRAGIEWQKAGTHSAGNGALMRIAPIIGPHLKFPSQELWKDAAVCSAVTHNDPASIACCVAFVMLLSTLLTSDQLPEPGWWADTFEAIAGPIEGETKYQPRGGVYLGSYTGSLTRFTVREVRKALANDIDTVSFGERVYSGAYLMETMPCVLFILAKYGSDPERSILEAVNHTKDNDTIAAIVGAAIGAFYGRDAIPSNWIDNLTGRLGANDDGRVFELVNAATEAWVN